MMKAEAKRVEMDLKKIFLTPPTDKREKITLFSVLLVSFVIFFAPLIFTQMPPIKGIFISMLPAISISWGWIVLLRSLFYKTKFSKTSK